MGRKKKSGGGKSAVIVHKEAFQRMNFLYQAAHSVLSSTPSQPQLARFYIHTMKAISKRLVLKIDPAIKRTICKSCDTLLVPGVTCTHRIRASRERHLVVKCLTCGALKRFLARENHQLWSEREGNVVPSSSPSHTSTHTAPSTHTAATPASTHTGTIPPSTHTAAKPTSTQTATTPPSTHTAPTPTSTQTATTPPSTRTATTSTSTQTATTPPSTHTAPTPTSTQTATTPPSTRTATTSTSTHTATTPEISP